MVRQAVQTNGAGKITVVLESTEKEYEYEPLGVSFDSTDEEILNAVAPLVLEEEGISITEDFIVRKVEASKSVILFPKSVAGIL